MNDFDIREALLTELTEKHKDDSQARLFNEFSLQHGLNRIDLIVLKEDLHGFEIKSDKDSLERLFDQMRVYNTIFDRMTLVIGWRHFEAAIKIIPEWWGIQLACSTSQGSVEIYEFRESAKNPNIDAFSLAKLLWKSEAIEMLEQYGLVRSLNGKNRRDIYQELIKRVNLTSLKQGVVEVLRSRKYWKVDELHVSDDDLCLL